MQKQSVLINKREINAAVAWLYVFSCMVIAHYVLLQVREAQSFQQDLLVIY